MISRLFAIVPLIVSLTLFAALVTSSPAFAYYAVLDNAEVMEEGKYKVTGDTQFFTDEGGAELGGRFDMGLSEDSGVRGMVGFGQVNVFFGGMFKWIPIPDVDDQPAVGGNVGVVYADDDDVRILTLRFEPLISKKFEVGTAFFTPYGSLPIGLRMRDFEREDDENDVALQLVAGSQLQLENLKNLQFSAELGINIDNAPSYVALAAILYFDGENGISLN